MSATTPERLAYMANQIATNLARTDDPVAATAEHIRSFWSPAMRAMLRSEPGAALQPVARAALDQLADPTAPGDHQHRATDPAQRGSDAG